MRSTGRARPKKFARRGLDSIFVSSYTGFRQSGVFCKAEREHPPSRESAPETFDSFAGLRVIAHLRVCIAGDGALLFPSRKCQSLSVLQEQREPVPRPVKVREHRPTRERAYERESNTASDATLQLQRTRAVTKPGRRGSVRPERARTLPLSVCAFPTDSRRFPAEPATRPPLVTTAPDTGSFFNPTVAANASRAGATLPLAAKFARWNPPNHEDAQRRISQRVHHAGGPDVSLKGARSAC